VVIERARLSLADGPLVEAPILAAEILSPTERPARKLREYGLAGLRYYLTFDVRGGTLSAYQADDHGRLVMRAEAGPGEPLTLKVPFTVALDPAALHP
jgi:Uma2 family endonuclease